MKYFMIDVNWFWKQVELCQVKNENVRRMEENPENIDLCQNSKHLSTSSIKLWFCVPVTC